MDVMFSCMISVAACLASAVFVFVCPVKRDCELGSTPLLVVYFSILWMFFLFVV